MEEDIKILEEFCKHGGYKSNGLPVAFIEIPYTVLKQTIEHLLARYKELKEENERLKYSITKATEIIDEYANETEMDTKKLIEYQEKYLDN